jgi:hypothetical protein
LCSLTTKDSLTQRSLEGSLDVGSLLVAYSDMEIVSEVVISKQNDTDGNAANPAAPNAAIFFLVIVARTGKRASRGFLAQCTVTAHRIRSTVEISPLHSSALKKANRRRKLVEMA